MPCATDGFTTVAEQKLAYRLHTNRIRRRQQFQGIASTKTGRTAPKSGESLVYI